MVWNVKDIADIKQSVRYYMGADNEPPKYGKYSYVEKVEYWSLLWGTVVMILSGLFLWFPFTLPSWLVNAALIVHSYEAALAVSAIVVWHMYTVHLSPDHFPMSWTWINGKMSAEEMKEHHPLEYDRLIRERRRTSGPAER
jgi:cytochrome b subunit of formate dehydrogenase